MSQKWIEYQLAKLPSVSSFEPKMQPGSEDRVIGVLHDPDLRNIWRLMDYFYQLADELELAGDFMEISEAEHEEKRRELKLFRASYSVLSGLFWLVIDWEYPATKDKPGLAICEGWRIIHRKVEHEEVEKEGGSSLDIFFNVPDDALDPIYSVEPDEELIGEFQEGTGPSKRILH